MRSEIRLSAIEDKSKKKLLVLKKKYEFKSDRLRNMLDSARDFNIPLTDLQERIIREKKWFYFSQQNKIDRFIEWKYHNNCDGELRAWRLSVDELERIRTKHHREEKLKRILK